MDNLFKKIWLRIINYLDFKHHTNFDFEDYLITSGFEFISEKEGFKMYINNYSETIKIHLLLNVKNEEVSIINKGKLCARINFIPKGSLFVDLLFNQTINNIIKNKENNVREQ